MKSSYLKIISLSYLIGASLVANVGEDINLSPVTEEMTEKAKAQPLNLANRNLGSRLVTSDTSENEKEGTSGLSEDITDGLELKEGESVFYIALKNKSNLNQFSVHSFKAKGKIEILSMPSLTSPPEEWKPLSTEQSILPNRETVVEFPFESTQFVALKFEINQPGTLSKLDLSGEDTINQVSSLMVLTAE